jgi:hypothetical protein
MPLMLLGAEPAKLFQFLEFSTSAVISTTPSLTNTLAKVPHRPTDHYNSAQHPQRACYNHRDQHRNTSNFEDWPVLQ